MRLGTQVGGLSIKIIEHDGRLVSAHARASLPSNRQEDNMKPLTQIELAICRQTGISQIAYAASKKRRHLESGTLE